MAAASFRAPVRWVGSDVDGLPLKRKQVAQACGHCRKRKKRCGHVKDTDDTALSLGDDNPKADRRSHSGLADHAAGREPLSRTGGQHSQSSLPASPASTGSSQGADEEDATQVAANHLVELSSSRFVGDLNPEGFFIEAATPTLPATRSSYRDSNDLGVWLPPGEITDEKPADAIKTAKATPYTPRRRQGSRSQALSDVALLYQKAKRNYIRECLAVIPPPSDYAALHRLYCEKVHPLFPVLKDAELVLSDDTLPPCSSSNTYPAIVRQVIALAAAQVDMETSKPHLRLEEGGPLLSPREFHRCLADALATVLEADVLPNQFDYVRILILTAFFYQPSSGVDRNRPPSFCNLAVLHFHTLGAHLQGYRPQRPDDDVERTFCALWALDRFCSVFYARPVMMHPQDLGKNIDEAVAKQPPGFRLFMVLVVWLDRVIQLYRPRQPFVLIDIPVFESLILDAEAERMPAMHIGTLEVFYHTVCVLSCRQPNSAFVEAASARDRAYLPLSIINPRRSHSTDRIVWVTQTQPICCFPFVPYAVSLALSVQYKKLRYSRTPMFRIRARANFKDIVELLKSMSNLFLSVRVNAALGESILTQLEKTANTLAREELEGSHQARAPGNAPATRTGTPAIVSFATSDSGMAMPSATPTTSAAPTFPLGLIHANGRSDDIHAAVTAPSTIAPLTSSIEATSHDLRASVGPIQAPTTTSLLDYSIMETLGSDVDLFSNFDPSFDLGAVDTALEANLDMGIPQNWTPWNNAI